MRWTTLGLLSMSIFLSGCGKPVVYKPITNKTVKAENLPPEGVVIRTFAGFTHSESDKYAGTQAPAVAVLSSGRKKDKGRCRFIFFVGDMIVPIDFPIEGDPTGNAVRVEGKAWDPRGWDVHWTAELKGDIVTGTFKQPHDHGSFRLREVK